MAFLDIALYIFIGVVLIQVIFFTNIFGRFAFLKQKPKHKTSDTPVSIVICAKNEAEHLKMFLPSIIRQDYSSFEIVLINDGSHDETLEVMEHFSSKYQNIKIVNVKPLETFWGNKKYPLTLGIKAATHNLLLFTDADCKPISRQWVSEMVSHFNSEKSIILGYGGYSKIKNSFLNKLIRFETLTTAMSYFSFAKLGIPYMGVGRNLAYKKSQFFEINGFMGHMNIRSGDDDLFVNEAATNSNTAICFSKESFTTSVPKTSFKAWYKQKRRHVSTAKYYKTKHKALLALFYTTNFLFWALTILLLSVWYMPILILCVIIFRIIVQYIVYGFSAKKLNETDLLPFIPFLEIFLITFQLAIFISNNISKPKHWK